MQRASARLRRLAHCGIAAATLALSVGCQLPAPDLEQSPIGAPAASLDDLAVAVPATANRAVSFTNKRSAFYYTQTHVNDHPEHAWFRGFNLAGRRIFGEYRVRIDGQALDPATAQVTVRPDVMVRTYASGIAESLRLFDDEDVVEVEVTGAPERSAVLELSGDTISRDTRETGLIDWYTSRQEPGAASVDVVAVGRKGNRFLIVVAPDREAARTLLERAIAAGDAWRATRSARLYAVINGDHFLATDDLLLTTTLRWLSLTTDSLVTRQRGDGIYAGLPWFNEYWGRDSFIALPGAVLVTGRFEEARAILTSFARFQELDPASRFYGRLPNIVKPGSIDFHTTDGTPRWVIALRDYVRYTGDTAIVGELYPNVKASIDGALAHFTDAAGYLLHADNETWMDARREPDKASYSPRSTRANDIQALWYEQLRAGARFAAEVHDAGAARHWTAAADRLRASFKRDFVIAQTAQVADHLDARGVRNLQQRPNALFVLPLIDDASVSARALRSSWEALVYPWGVATLAQADPDFHPYHLAPERYHKDAAYHNGAVWPWLNGVAMQRMLERGQVEIAWRLFANTNALAASRGVVGGLPENLDAYPHPGDAAPRLTGTYLQAWSNAEQLRLWYQGFLGVQPELDRGVVRVAPQLPRELGAVRFVARVGLGALHARYDSMQYGRQYSWRSAGQPLTLEVDIAPYEVRSFGLGPGETIVVSERGDRLEARRVAGDGSVGDASTIPRSAERVAQQAVLDAILRDTRFAQPGIAEAHPVMRETRTP